MLIQTSFCCPKCGRIDFDDYFNEETLSTWYICGWCDHRWEESDGDDEIVDEINWADYLEEV